MKPNLRPLAVIILFLTLVSLACGISIPNGGVIDSAATSVAGTVNALAATAQALVTELPHDLVETTAAPFEELPTLPPPSAGYPLRVSFASPDGNLYTWAEGMGSPQLLASDGDICCSFVSPDGSLIAFTRYAEYNFTSLEVINADGSNRHVLLDAAQAAALPRPDGSIGAEPGQIAWVPDSHLLSLNFRLLYEGPGLAYGDALYQIDADTGGSGTILHSGSESWKFVYSPDGSKIAVSLPTQVDTYNADGSLIAAGILHYDFVNTASEYAWVASPVWSADGLEMLVSAPPANPWDAIPGDSSIYRVSYNGSTGELRNLGAMPALTGGSVAFSPDLSKFLCFTRLGDPADNTFTLNVGFMDYSPSQEYTSGQFMYDPVWSPDNTHFFYTTGAGNTQYPFIGEVGAAPAPVSDYTNAANVQWIDANRYLTVSNNGGVSRLLMGNLGAPTGLIYDHGSPSSNFLTYSVNR